MELCRARAQPLISIQKPSGAAMPQKLRLITIKNGPGRGFQANLKTLHTNSDHHKIFNNVRRSLHPLPLPRTRPPTS